MTELLLLPPVEGDPGGVPAVWAHQDLQLHAGGHNNRAERQRVGTDGRDHDGGHRGVDHAGPGRHSVGRAAGGSGDNQPVALTNKSKLITYRDFG